MEKTRTKFRSTKVMRKLDPLHIPQHSFDEKFEINNMMQDQNNCQNKTEDNFDAVTVKRKHSQSDQEINNQILPDHQIVSSIQIPKQLVSPYEFIGVTQPSIRTIILPWFKFKSITFVLSIIMFVMFIALFITHQILPKSDTSWGCLLFKSQNKFFPRLRTNYQFWRVPISALFHSNFSHLILNLVALQLYGYFVQWYFGSIKYTGLIILSIINSHFLSCLTNIQTVSTTASGITYSILAVKILFFIKYKNYQPLQSKRIALYGLLCLVFGINILVLFIGGNVDIGSHIGGLITGLLFASIFYQFQTQSKNTKIFKYSMITFLSIISIMLIVICFCIQSEKIQKSNISIDNLC